MTVKSFLIFVIVEKTKRGIETVKTYIYPSLVFSLMKVPRSLEVGFGFFPKGRFRFPKRVN